MSLKLGISDYTFPKLTWDQALRLANDLGVEGIDIGIFAGRSHLRPEEVLFKPAVAAAKLVTVVRAHGLGIADIFGQPGAAFEEKAVNHPDQTQRKSAAEFFWRLLELAARCNAKHISLLPGAHFKQENPEDSLKRSADELAWRVEAAARMGIALGTEAHIGSVIPTPAHALKLLDLTPGLTMTLDYGHFACQGIPDAEVEPLLARTSHVHARAACKDKLQASFGENTIGFAQILRRLRDAHYAGYIVLEYVWTEWMHCNEVDNLSETILLRDHLRSLDSALGD